MKRLFLLLLYFLTFFAANCTIQKAVITNNDDVLKGYMPPLTVFSIGNWTPGYNVITLTDAHKQFYIIKALQKDSLKIGEVYHP